MRKEQIKRFFSIFPCANRDQLARLFFSQNSNPTLKCTQHMQQCRKEGWIEVNAERKPYVYFASPVKKVKKYSAALDHHLTLVDIYIDLIEVEPSVKVVPEVNFGKGFPRVDLIIQLWNQWYFTEVQRTRVTLKKMRDKISQYEDLYIHSKHEDICEEFTILLITERSYDITSRLPLIQVSNIKELLG